MSNIDDALEHVQMLAHTYRNPSHADPFYWETSDALEAVLTLARSAQALQARVEELEAENARLREANGILEDALQEVGDDYPGSSCQEWCQQQVKAARAALSGEG